MERRHIGACSELVAAADLMQRGYDVFRALSQHASYDLIAVKGDEMLRVEVRTIGAGQMRKDGTFTPRVNDFDGCDTYAFVLKEEIVYMTRDEAFSELRQRHFVNR